MSRAKGAPTRPIIEKLDGIAAHELPISSISRGKTATLPNISLRHPWLAAVRFAHDAVEFHLPSLHRSTTGPVQQFGIKAQKVGFGTRYFFICDCGKPVWRLYHLHRRIACRVCHGATYASHNATKKQRVILQLTRIQSFLDNAKLTKRSRDKLIAKYGHKALMAQCKYGTQAKGPWD
jgi:hypothetical protein